MIYLFLLLLIFIGLYIYDYGRIKKNRIGYFYFLILLLSVTTGISYRLGIDVTRYELEYIQYSTLFDINNISYFSSFNDRMPLWVFFNTIFRTFNLPFFCFHIFQTTIINIAVGRTIIKYSNYPYLSLIIYIVTVFTSYNYEIMRESLAVAVFLCSVSYFLKSKYRVYYIYSIIAFGFHLSAFVLFVLPIIRFLPVNKIAVLIVGILSLLVLFFSDLFFEQLHILLDINLFSAKAASYFANERLATSRLSLSFIFNIFFYVLCTVFVYVKMLNTDKDWKGNKYFHLVMLYMLFYCCSIVLPFFYRINNYFIVFFIIYLTNLLDLRFRLFKISNKQIRKLVILILIGFIVMKANVLITPISGTSFPAYLKYYPYSSIFTKEICREREYMYDAFN